MGVRPIRDRRRPLGAQFAATHCETADDVVLGNIPVKILLGCASAFPDNLLWHLDRVDQPSAELDGRAFRGFGGAGAVIYVVDSGVLAAHDEFDSRVIGGIDLVPASGNPCPSPDQALQPCGNTPATVALASHGSGAASVAGGMRVGVAPDAAIVSVRIISAYSNPTMARFDAALDAIREHAFDPRTPPFRTAIVNFSLSVPEPDSSGVSAAAIEEKMRAMTTGVDSDGRWDANGKRFFFTFAAGNAPAACPAGGVSAIFPARMARHAHGMVSVGGMTAANGLWSGGCVGEVYAPAEEIFVATSTAHNHYRGGGPVFARSGTSWSAPIVAGLAARLLHLEPNLTPAQIELGLLATASALSDAGGKVPVFAPVARPGKRRSVRH